MFVSRKRLQLFLKVLLAASVIGVYFIVLLRESFAAWESTSTPSILSTSDALAKVKNGIADQQKQSSHRGPLHRHHHRAHSATANKSINGATNATAHLSNHSRSSVSTTVNSIYEYSEEKQVEAEHDFQIRREHLDQMCTKYDYIQRYAPNAWEFFISSGHGIAWCNVFKAASSTWMYYFNILGGYDVRFLQKTKVSPLELARKRFARPQPHELNEALSSALSFLIVREPFERLLSGFRNKLEGQRNKFYKIVGEKIIKDYRKGSKRRPFGPTFNEFIAFLIDSHKNGRPFDEHWSPIYSFCTPCSINYTLIAKVETFQRDTEYIIRQTGLETLLLNKMPAGKQVRAITNGSARQTAKLITKYYSQLDVSMLRDLLKIYGPDFDLFGYDSTKYFDIVKSDKPPSTDANVFANTTTTTTTTPTITTG